MFNGLDSDDDVDVDDSKESDKTKDDGNTNDKKNDDNDKTNDSETYRKQLDQSVKQFHDVYELNGKIHLKQFAVIESGEDNWFTNKNGKVVKIENIKLICCDCSKKFTFTKKQQEHFKKNGWEDPIRCKNCRRQKNKSKLV